MKYSPGCRVHSSKSDIQSLKTGTEFSISAPKFPSYGDMSSIYKHVSSNYRKNTPDLQDLFAIYQHLYGYYRKNTPDLQEV